MKKLIVSIFLLLVSVCASAQMIPFSPLTTVNVVVTGTAQTLALPTDQSGVTSAQVVIQNVGTQTVFFRTDGTTATASNGMPIQAGQAFVITITNKLFSLSVIAATTGSTLYATVGVGL